MSKMSYLDVINQSIGCGPNQSQICFVFCRQPITGEICLNQSQVQFVSTHDIYNIEDAAPYRRHISYVTV